MGHTVFEVAVFVPAHCAECWGEIPEHKRDQPERLPGVLWCESCQQEAEWVQRKEPPRKKAKICARCARDVAAEMGENRQGDYVCIPQGDFLILEL